MMIGRIVVLDLRLDVAGRQGPGVAEDIGDRGQLVAAFVPDALEPTGQRLDQVGCDECEHGFHGGVLFVPVFVCGTDQTGVRHAIIRSLVRPDREFRVHLRQMHH